MLIAQAEGSLRDRLRELDLSIDDGDVDRLAAAMIDWYAGVRVHDAAAPAEDGDMLLFEWGTYDWGSGRHFELRLARQMSTTELDPDIVQLALRFEYRPVPATDEVSSGHRWCGRPEDADELPAYLRGHEAIAVARSERPIRVTLEAESVE